MRIQKKKKIAQSKVILYDTMRIKSKLRRIFFAWYIFVVYINKNKKKTTKVILISMWRAEGISLSLSLYDS